MKTAERKTAATVTAAPVSCSVLLAVAVLSEDFSFTGLPLVLAVPFGLVAWNLCRHLGCLWARVSVVAAAVSVWAALLSIYWASLAGAARAPEPANTRPTLLLREPQLPHTLPIFGPRESPNQIDAATPQVAPNGGARIGPAHRSASTVLGQESGKK